MQIRAGALSALVALASIGSVQAQTTEPKLSVSGTVVSTGNTSMVVKSDENGHPMSFLMSTTTLVPAGLSAGSRVTVSYHLIGATGRMADTVRLLDTAASQSTEPSQSAGPSESVEESAAQLPAAARLLPLAALIGLVALLGSLSLRVLARRRS